MTRRSWVALAVSRWLPVLAWMGILFLLSAQSTLPGLPDALGDTLLKKGGHAAGYAVLAGLAARAFAGGRALAGRDLWLGALVAACYGLTDEYHQTFVPGRTPRLTDWGVDCLGAALAVALLWWRSRAADPAFPAAAGGGHGIVTGSTPAPRAPTRRALAAVLLSGSAVFWGGSFIAARAVLVELSPIALATTRFSLASVFFLVLLALVPRYRMPWRDLPRMGLFGLLAITFYFIFQYNGVARTSASLSSIVVSLSPLVVVLLSVVFLRDRLTRRRVTGVALASLGVVLLVTRSSPELGGGADYWLGIAFLAMNVLAWGLYNVAAKATLASADPLSLTAYMTILGALALWPFAVVDGGGAALGTLSAGGWLAVGYLVVFCTIAAYLAYNYALRLVTASEAGVYLYFNPVATVVLASLLLSEPVTAATLLGGGMAIVGVYLASGSGGSWPRADHHSSGALTGAAVNGRMPPGEATHGTTGSRRLQLPSH